MCVQITEKQKSEKTPIYSASLFYKVDLILLCKKANKWEFRQLAIFL